MPRYKKIPVAAREVQTSDKTIRNWLGNGLIRGYRVGPRQILVDLDEIEAMLAVTPRTKARDGRRAYGPRSEIVDLTGVVLPGVEQ